MKSCRGWSFVLEERHDATLVAVRLALHELMLSDLRCAWICVHQTA